MESDDGDAPLDGDMSPEAYDELVDALAGDTTNRTVEAARESGGDYAGALRDAVWESVARVVPHLTEPVCRRVLALGEHDPDAELVDAVAEERHSTDAERLRARALTVLVQDVTARIAAAAPEEPPTFEEFETGRKDS